MQLRTVVRFLFALFVFQTNTAFAQNVLRGVTLSSWATAQDIEDLSEWGPNVVRYPLEPITGFVPETELAFYDRLDRSLARLDELLPEFEAHGMKVIVELYSPPGGFVRISGSPQHRIFAEAWAQQALRNAWMMIASRYKDDARIWGYDVVNEPAQAKVTKGLMNWSKLSVALAYDIRNIDSRHKIIIESVYGNPVLIRSLKRIPLPNIVYSVHIYVPNKFVQQGLHGYPVGLSYPGKGLNKKAIAKVLSPVVKFQNKGAEIYIGEFSVVRWAPGNSAYNYLADVIDLMEARGWHWTYHAFREADAWSVELTTDRFSSAPSLSTTDREMLLRQWFSHNQ